MRRRVFGFGETDKDCATRGRVRFAVGSFDSRVGRGSHSQERGARDVWSVRVHAQPALLWEFFARARLHDRVGPTGSRVAVCGPVSWHLFSGDARRSLDVGGALWQGLRGLQAVSAAV